MYQLYGIKTCLTAFGIACGLVMAIWAVITPPAEPGEIWRLISGSVTLVSALAFVLGQTPAFPWLCRRPLIRLAFPDIDGRWTGTLESNWPEIQRRASLVTPGVEPPVAPVLAQVTIKARLFFVRMNLESTSGYSKSKTIFVRVSRDAEDGEVRLNYMYENTTLKPEETDSGKHHGAAFLDLKQEAPKRYRFEGIYWTDRNWHKALNTAGKIVLRRVDDDK